MYSIYSQQFSLKPLVTLLFCNISILAELAPTFRKKPLEREMYAAEGKNVTIVCNPEAAPRPKFTWRQGSLVIGNGEFYRVIFPPWTFRLVDCERVNLRGFYMPVYSASCFLVVGIHRNLSINNLWFWELHSRCYDNLDHDILYHLSTVYTKSFHLYCKILYLNNEEWS